MANGQKAPAPGLESVQALAKFAAATATIANAIGTLVGGGRPDLSFHNVPKVSAPSIIHRMAACCNEKAGKQFDAALCLKWWMDNRIETFVAAITPEERADTISLHFTDCKLHDGAFVRQSLGDVVTNFLSNPARWEETATCLAGGGCYDLLGSLVGMQGALNPEERRAAETIIKQWKQFAEEHGQDPEEVDRTIEFAVQQDIIGIAGDADFIGGNFTQRILNALAEPLSNAITSIEGFIEAIGDNLSAALTDSLDVVIESFNSILDPIEDAIGRAFDSVGELYDKAVSQLTSTITDVQDYLERSYAAIVDGVTEFIDDAQNVIAESWEFVTEQTEQLLDASSRVVDEIQSGIGGAIDGLADAAGGTVDALRTTLGGIPEKLADLGDSIGEFFRQHVAEPLRNTPVHLFDLLADKAADTTEAEINTILDRIEAALVGRETTLQSREDAAQFFRDILPDSPITRTIISWILVPFMLLTVTSGLASAQSQIILQEASLTAPYQLLPVGEVVTGFNWGLIERQEATETIRKLGYTEQDAERLLSIGKAVPNEQDVLSWWLRGLINDDMLTVLLQRRGHTEDAIDLYRSSAFFIPPVQDLISMAVREVFSPEVAERFGQFEDFPKEFEQWAARQGVSEQWARNYWAAHWALPSVQMGFEMLHRRIIDEADLKLLMRSQDIMPFWRDRLIQLSYSPLTRVDIRRIHAMGLMSDDDVRNAYLDLGYSQDNATLLMEFTRQLNSPPPADQPDDLEQLSRSQVIGFLEDGVIDQTKAIQLLIDQGYTEEAALLYTTQAVLEAERKDRKEQTDLILDQAKAGILTFEEAQDRLHQIGLQPAEIDKAITKLIRIQAANTKLPSRADLDRMIKAGLVTDAEYIDTMQRIGYSLSWARKYHQLATG